MSLYVAAYDIKVEPEDLDDLRFRVGLLLAHTDAFPGSAIRSPTIR